MSAIELRLLAGPAIGSSARLGDDRREWTIGRSIECDIVIDDPSVAELAGRLAMIGALFRLTVLDGVARMLGVPVPAGSTAIVAPFVPVQIGESWVALGDPDDPAGWAEAGAIVQAQLAADSAADAPADLAEAAAAADDEREAASAGNRAPAGWGQRLRRGAWRYAGGGLMAVGIWIVVQSQIGDPPAPPLADASGPAAPFPPPTPPRAAGAAADRLSKLSLPRGERVVAVVSGPARFIATSTGARYAEGSRLADGARIVRIDPDRIFVERDGATLPVDLN